MGKTYSFRPNGSGAARYVERIKHKTGKSKSEIIRQCVLLGKEADLFDEATQGAAVDQGTSEPVDVVDTGAADASDSAGGVDAHSLARVEEGDREEESEDARPQGVSRADGDEASGGRERKSFLSRLFS